MNTKEKFMKITKTSEDDIKEHRLDEYKGMLMTTNRTMALIEDINVVDDKFKWLKTYDDHKNLTFKRKTLTKESLKHMQPIKILGTHYNIIHLTLILRVLGYNVTLEKQKGIQPLIISSVKGKIALAPMILPNDM